MTLLEEMKVSIETMTMGEKFLASLQVTLLGVAIVFVALGMLFIIIKILDTFVHKAESSSAKRKEQKTAAAPVPTPEPVVAEKAQDDGELVAVIAAAVAASLHTSTHNIIVRNIVRVPDQAPAWNRLGRMQQINRQLH
ncbi:OadG family protein [Anoxynatronum buryatiense]|uniref:Sodium pump decarboxylases, gamma subunit n=1 Tax=Anoxynatronum buryatiense TaxID=489973 RepID=A0AA46AKJ3_9CLOT|nr:OadG family protein [Anoxynatronum buryatiense]SMP70265.1 sodium pump decarboxylases, gamma subunit [Anoxynatronum buryatiense]